MTVHFGTFCFNPASLELTRDGRAVRLEPQPARALAVLLSRPGEVVTREELRAAIWGEDTHVDYDRGLAYCIAQVRTALGDSGDNPRFVQTLPKRGFKFLAPVALGAVAATADAAAPVSDPFQGAPAASAGPAPSGWRRRGPWISAMAVATVAALVWVRADTPPRQTLVAVSIFDNETDDPGLDRFVTGLSDLVVTRLTALAPGRVGVIGNSAPLRRPRAIRNLGALSREVDADYIVIGQLQRQGEGLRFILHFIRLRDEVHLSARRLLRARSEVDGLDEEVADEAERVVREHLVGSVTP